MARDENIQGTTVLIHHSPKITPLAADRNEQLICMPDLTETTLVTVAESGCTPVQTSGTKIDFNEIRQIFTCRDRGEFWLARHRQLDVEAAVKVPNDEIAKLKPQPPTTPSGHRVLPLQPTESKIQ